METIERIKKYVEETFIQNAPRYKLGLTEFFELMSSQTAGPDSPEAGNAIILAFAYGRAKGYRAALAQRRAECGEA